MMNYYIFKAGGDTRSIVIMDCGLVWIIHVPLLVGVAYYLSLIHIYLLTPKVMEILLDLKKRLDLSVSFYDNKLYVAVADENDPFEIKLHDTIDESLLRKLHRDCADLCEILNLINQIEWNT